MSQSIRTQILAACVLFLCQNSPSQETGKILDSYAVQTGGRTITFQRIEPPQSVVSEAAAATNLTKTTAPALSREEILAKWKLLRPEFLSISCTVYETGVTSVRWWHNGGEYRVLSSIDFNFARGLSSFDADGRSYMVFMGIGNQMSASTLSRLRAGGAILPASMTEPAPTLPANVMEDIEKNGGSRYVVLAVPEGGAEAEAFQGIDALHRYFDAHKAELVAGWEKSEAERIAHEQWVKENPPVPQDTVIRFWKKKSSNPLANQEVAR